MSKYNLFTDGGSRGNPGNAATGAFLFNEQNELIDFTGKYLGVASNNVAEYNALIEGLELAIENKVKNLNCNLDSELIVKQLNGEYKVKHPDMKTLFDKVKLLIAKFDECKFTHIRREFNKNADKLVNLILDQAMQ